MFYIEENASNEDLQIAGVWREYAGAEFKIASFESPVFQKKQTALYLATGWLDDNGAIKTGKRFQAQHVAAYNTDSRYRQKLQMQAMSESILRDWKNVSLNRESGETKYNPKVALKMLMTNMAFFEFVIDTASDEAGTTYDTLSNEDKTKLGNEQNNTIDTQLSEANGIEKLKQSSNSTDASMN